MLNRRSAVIPPCSSLSLDKSAANKPKALSGSRLVVLQLVNVRAHESVLLLLAWCELKPREINARQQEKKRGEKQRSRSFRVFTRTCVNVTIHNSIGYIYMYVYVYVTWRALYTITDLKRNRKELRHRKSQPTIRKRNVASWKNARRQPFIVICVFWLFTSRMAFALAKTDL